MNLSPKSLDIITQDTKSRDEVENTASRDPCEGLHSVVKIDAGASGNTLPMRTFQQIYGTHSFHVLEPVTNVRLTACNGATKKCFGKVEMCCSYKDD